MPKADRDLFRRARILSSALAGFFYTNPQSIFGYSGYGDIWWGVTRIAPGRIDDRIPAVINPP
jgi:hypothetical protein